MCTLIIKQVLLKYRDSYIFDRHSKFRKLLNLAKSGRFTLQTFPMSSSLPKGRSGTAPAARSWPIFDFHPNWAIISSLQNPRSALSGLTCVYRFSGFFLRKFNLLPLFEKSNWSISRWSIIGQTSKKNQYHSPPTLPKTPIIFQTSPPSRGLPG